MPGQAVSKLVDETANLLVLLTQSVTTKRLLAAKTDLAGLKTLQMMGFVVVVLVLELSGTSGLYRGFTWQNQSALGALTLVRRA